MVTEFFLLLETMQQKLPSPTSLMATCRIFNGLGILSWDSFLQYIEK